MRTLARAVMEDWIMNFGMPKLILSDNGSEFCNKFFEEFCKLLNIKHITTSAAYPQANGRVNTLNYANSAHAPIRLDCFAQARTLTQVHAPVQMDYFVQS